MNPALMNQNALPIIGSGPLASAPAASAGNNNALYYDNTTEIVYQCVGVFKNAGTDYINCGRPAHLLSLLCYDNTFSVHCVARLANISQGAAIIAIADSIIYRFGMVITEGQIRVNIGTAQSTIPAIYTTYRKYSAIKRFSDSFYVSDGIESGKSTTPVNVESASDLFIGGRTDGVTSNFEGEIAKICFCDGYGAIVDVLDFNKWDGSASGASLMGYPYTVTDGAPFTAKSYAWVPLSMLQ